MAVTTARCVRRSALAVLVVQALLRLSAAQQARSCIEHAECGDGFFCMLKSCDSFEGWQYPCSFCESCAQCVCNADSSSGTCPVDQCPSAPTGRVKSLEGSFHATAWTGGQVCKTTLIVQGRFFRMVSFLVDARLYDKAVDLLPPQAEGGEERTASLCDFPDSPGQTEGMLEMFDATDTNMMATLRLTYVSGLPLGVTRVVNLYENCPLGVLAEFEPIAWLPMPLNREVGLTPPRYLYRSGAEELPYLVLPKSGYAYSEHAEAGVVRAALNGPAAGYRDLLGDFSGYFEYGTTRRSEQDLGGKPGIVCNATLHFERGQQGVVQWDQYTWGCEARYPPLTHLRSQAPESAFLGDAALDEEKAARDLQAEPLPLSAPAFARTLNRDYTQSALNRRAPAVCPAGSLTIGPAESLTQGSEAAPLSAPTCELCPSGRYQHRPDSSTCLSCPAGFINDINGSSSLADCCIQEQDVGLYNDRYQTSYNIFGYANGTISGEYFKCPNGRQYPMGSCTSTQQNISTRPVTNRTDAGTASRGTCSDVRFTVQPMMGDTAVPSLIALDFSCPSCALDIGKYDNVTISLFRVSAATVMPSELQFRYLPPPSSDFSDFKHSRAPLDDSLDPHEAVFQFHTSTFPTNPNISRHQTPDVFFMSPQVPLNRTLSNWNAMFDKKQSRYMCSYEEPGGSPERSLSMPPRTPICAEEMAERISLLDHLEFNHWTPMNRDGSMSPPVVVGLKVLARLKNTASSASGFRVGYKFSQFHAQCRPGSFVPTGDFFSSSVNENLQCEQCPPGKFTPSDHSTYCFDCPKGTYSSGHFVD